MLVELKLVEQRYRAVIDVLDGMSVTDVARRNGVSRQSVHTWLRRYANGGMAALADKSSKPESCPHQMPPVIEAESSSCAGRIRGGDPGPSALSWPRRGSAHRPDALRSIAPWCAIICSTRRRANARAPTTSAGSAPAPWSCGRWTSSDASISPTAPRSRSSPASTTIHGSACVPESSLGRRRDRSATPCRGRCAPTACPTRSSPTTARSSRRVSAKDQDPCSSIGSVPTTGSVTSSRLRTRRRPRAR